MSTLLGLLLCSCMINTPTLVARHPQILYPLIYLLREEFGCVSLCMQSVKGHK